MTPIQAPSDKRFRRAHVSPARRRAWYRSPGRLAGVTLALLLSATLCYALVASLGSSRAFTITSISVTGNERISDGEVHALLEGVLGTNMLVADLEAWRQKLRALPWVAEADIRRVFPGSISVTLTERHAVAIARMDGMLHVIDETATRIDEYAPRYAQLDLPIIDGLATGRSGALIVDEARAALAGRLLTALQSRPDLAAQVSQIDVTDVRNAVVVLDHDPALLRLGTEHFVERLQLYIDLASALREQVPDIDYADLRYDNNRIVVKPHGAAGPRKTSGSGPG